LFTDFAHAFFVSQEWVLTNVIRKRFCEKAHVPSDWPETLYGRLKKNGFHTAWHCDSLNTIVQRKLLENYEPQSSSKAAVDKRDAWLKGSSSDDRFPSHEKLPIYTFWVSLNNLYSLKQSHLRVHSDSHTQGEIIAMKDKATGDVTRIAPRGYKVCPPCKSVATAQHPPNPW
jgi:hypothetical protein